MTASTTACQFCPTGSITSAANDEVDASAATQNDLTCKKYHSFEEVLNDVKSFGKYQKFVSLLILYATIQWTGTYMFTDLLQSIRPQWTCDDNIEQQQQHQQDVNNVDNNNNTLTTRLVESRIKNMLILENGDDENDAQLLLFNFNQNNRKLIEICQIIDNCKNLTTSAKQRKHSKFYSIVQEWHLVCGNSILMLWLTILNRSLRALGAIIGGHLADWYGRKPLVFVGQFLLCLTSVLQVASQNWLTFVIIKSTGSFVYGSVSTAAMTLALECTESKHRYIPNACFIQSFAWIWISLTAFLTRDWRMYLIIINLITVPVLLGTLLIHESPRWLIQVKRYREACEILDDVASERWNDCGIPEFTPESLEKIPQSGWQQRGHTVKDLFVATRLRPYWRQSIIQILSFLTLSFTSNILLTSTKNNFLSLNEFASIAFYGFLGIEAPFLVILLDKKFKRFGRKSLYLITLATIVIAFTLTFGFTMIDNPAFSQLKQLSQVFIIIGTVVSDTGYQMAIYQITVEYYPTRQRAIALGFFNAVFEIGAIGIICAVWFNPFPNQPHSFRYGIASITAIVTFLLGVRWQTETKVREWVTDWSQQHQKIDKVLEKPDKLVGKIIARTPSAQDLLAAIAIEDIDLNIDYSKRNSFNALKHDIADRRKSIALGVGFDNNNINHRKSVSSITTAAANRDIKLSSGSLKVPTTRVERINSSLV